MYISVVFACQINTDNNYNSIAKIGSPGSPPRRENDDFNGCPLFVPLVIIVAGFYNKFIFPWRKISIVCTLAIFGLSFCMHID